MECKRFSEESSAKGLVKVYPRQEIQFIRTFPSLTNVLQPQEPARRVGEVAAEARAGSTDEIQQHKEILEETESRERSCQGQPALTTEGKACALCHAAGWCLWIRQGVAWPPSFEPGGESRIGNRRRSTERGLPPHQRR